MSRSSASSATLVGQALDHALGAHAGDAAQVLLRVVAALDRGDGTAFDKLFISHVERFRQAGRRAARSSLGLSSEQVVEARVNAVTVEAMAVVDGWANLGLGLLLRLAAVTGETPEKVIARAMNPTPADLNDFIGKAPRNG